MITIRETRDGRTLFESDTLTRPARGEQVTFPLRGRMHTWAVDTVCHNMTNGGVTLLVHWLFENGDD